MKIKIAKTARDFPYELLLVADETIGAINRYLYASEVYVAKMEAETIGVCCLLFENQDTVEIKNIAIAPRLQHRGIGSYLLGEMEKIARQRNCRTVIVGTADSGAAQIRFYEKNGYERYAMRENFFVEHYRDPIYENGVMLRDMVMLRKGLGREKLSRCCGN